MTRKQKRLSVIGGALVVLACAAGLVLFALQQRIAFFRMPSDIAAADLQSESRFRLGGLVEKGSVVRGTGTRITFAVTDRSSGRARRSAWSMWRNRLVAAVR